MSISKSCSKAIFKIKGRPTMFVPLKEADMSSAENKSLLNGKGQNKETMNKQKKVLGKSIQNKYIIQAFLLCK